MGDPTDCDLLVIGSGAAGLSAAVTASCLGLNVLVCEHSNRIGGTTALSGGEVWIPGNRQAKGGAGNDTGSALRYLRHVAGDGLDEPRASAFVERAGEALAFLEDHSHLEYELLKGVLDYDSDAPGATIGLRSLSVMPFDGRRLGGYFEKVRAPLPASMIFGGMALGREDIPHYSQFFRSPASLVHVTRMVAAHARDRLRGYSRGTRMVMGNALIGRLTLSLLERNVPIWLGARVTALQRENGRVHGAIVEHGERTRRVHARRGVIVASGSFSGSRSMQRRFFRHVAAGRTHRSHLPVSNDGSGLELIVECGGEIDRRVSEPGAWAPISVVPMPDGSEAVMPHFGERARPGFIIVDATGRRFANEAFSYHRFVQAMLANGEKTGSAECFVVTSHRHLRKYGLGRVPPFPGRLGPYLRSGYLLRASTPSELARRLGMDPEVLASTLKRFDRHAALGEDPDFAKGATAYERAAGDPAVVPNPCIAPLGSGPYYAVRLFPGDIGTLLGVRADEHARVLTDAGVPVPGLYAAGTVASSIMGGTYPAAGSMLGPSITFAYIAACHAADDRNRLEEDTVYSGSPASDHG